MKPAVKWGLICFALLVWVGALGGCATSSDSANESARPWNAPRNWEHGLPTGGMYERR